MTNLERPSAGSDLNIPRVTTAHDVIARSGDRQFGRRQGIDTVDGDDGDDRIFAGGTC